jgi:hypothetical protein
MEVAPRPVVVPAGGADVRVDLGVPSLARVREPLCGSAAAASDSSGLLAGRVRDARTGAAVTDATVVLTWDEVTIGVGGIRPVRRRAPVKTGLAGTYLLCGAPPGDGVVASAEAPGLASGVVEIDVPVRGLLVRDFALGESLPAPHPAADTTAGAARPADAATPRLARGTARLTGIVRDARGRPVRGARAFVRGAVGTATTDEAGAFALGGLPAGTWSLEVRAIGFAPGRVAVDLEPGRATAATVSLSPPAQELERVVVVGDRSRRSFPLDEFLARKRTNAFGRFLTAADIERQGTPYAITDALRMTPGLRIVPTGGFGNAIVGRGGCTPAVVLDGFPITGGAAEIDQLVFPQQVAGIEVYAGPNGAPAQYASGLAGGGCGVVLIWTKR